jgi:TetR/AcrR family transcriptional regulator
MIQKRPTAAPRRDVRAALLAVAAEEFARHGAQGARVEVIYARAGANPRMIYHHFESKEGLYKAVLADEWGALAAALGPVLRKTVGLEPRAGLELGFLGFARILAERPLVQRLAMQEALSGWRYAPRATLAQIPKELRTLHRRGVKSGAFRKDVPFELLYFAVLGALNWQSMFGDRFADARRALGDGVQARQSTATMVGLILDGLACQPRHPKETP